MKSKATDAQIAVILSKHLVNVFNLKYTYDEEDSIGFIWCSSVPEGKGHYQCIDNNYPIIQWCIQGGDVKYFSLIKGGVEYEIDNPEGDLLKRLKDISYQAIKEFNDGSQI